MYTNTYVDTRYGRRTDGYDMKCLVVHECISLFWRQIQ